MPPPTGFLAVRLQTQAYGLLVTVTANPDISDRGGDRVARFTQLPDAVAHVTDFLLAWQASAAIDVDEELPPGEPSR
jgi:hypothetical protein